MKWHHAIARSVRLAAVLALALLAACGGSTDGAAGEQPNGDGGGSRPVVDWSIGYNVSLGGGWTLAPCEAGPTLMCIRLDGETQAVAELMTYSVRHYRATQAVLDGGGSSSDALAAVAADFHKVFAEDRPIGCGPGYEVRPFGPRPAQVGGLAGVTYGFEGISDGQRVERALQFAAIGSDTLYMIATTAIDDGTCMDDGELGELTIAEIDELEDGLAKAIATSRLPAVRWCQVDGAGAVPCDTPGVGA